MPERTFDNQVVRSSAVLEGCRYTALLAVSARAGAGFPIYYAVCENRSFRTRDAAEIAAAKAIDDMVGLETDGTPIFPDGYTGFNDDAESA